MKNFFFAFLFVFAASAQVGPPPASVSEVTAGTDTYKYVTPYGLAQAGITGGGGGAAVSNIYNLTFVLATRYTNDTDYYAQVGVGITYSIVAAAASESTFEVDTNVASGTYDTSKKHRWSGAALAGTFIDTTSEVVPPRAAFRIMNTSAGGSSVSITANEGSIIYFSTNSGSGGGSGDVTQSGLAAGSHQLGAFTNGFKIGYAYYSSNIVFYGSVSGINGTWEYDPTVSGYTNGSDSASTMGFLEPYKYFVANGDASVIFTNTTGLVSSNWFLNDGAGSAPISFWMGTSNYNSSRVSIPDNFATTNGSIIYIDPVNGNDWNWGRGRADKPMRTFSKLEREAVVGDTVFLYPGNYTNATYRFPEGMKMIGSGMNKSYIWAFSGQAADFALTNNCELSDLSIKGSIHISGGTNALIDSVKSTDLSDGIYNDNGIYVRVNDSVFLSGWDCIANFSTNTSTRIIVQNCVMESDGAASAEIRGIFNDGKGEIYITGGSIRLRNTSSATSTSAIRSTANATGNIYLAGTLIDITNSPNGNASYVAINGGSGSIYVNGSYFPKSRLSGSGIYNGATSYSTNYTVGVSNTAGLTNTTDKAEMWNIYGTSGTYAFYHRTGEIGSTVCGVAMWTNTVTAAGQDVLVGANCGIKFYSGVGTIISRRDF